MRLIFIALIILTLSICGCAPKISTTRLDNESLIHVENTMITLRLPSRWSIVDSKYNKFIPKGIDQLWVLKSSYDNLMYPRISISTYKGKEYSKNIEAILQSEKDTEDFIRMAMLKVQNGGPIDEIKIMSRSGEIEYIIVSRKNPDSNIDERMFVRFLIFGTTVVELNYTDRVSGFSEYTADFYKMY